MNIRYPYIVTLIFSPFTFFWYSSDFPLDQPISGFVLQQPLLSILWWGDNKTLFSRQYCIHALALLPHTKLITHYIRMLCPTFWFIYCSAFILGPAWPIGSVTRYADTKWHSYPCTVSLCIHGKQKKHCGSFGIWSLHRFSLFRKCLYFMVLLISYSVITVHTIFSSSLFQRKEDSWGTNMLNSHLLPFSTPSHEHFCKHIFNGVWSF